MPVTQKPSRSDVILDMIEHDIEREGFVRTKRDLSLAYSTAAERVGQNNFPRVRGTVPDGFRKSSEEQSIRRILNP